MYGKYFLIFISSLFGYFIIGIFFPILWIQGIYLRKNALRLTTPIDDEFGKIEGGNESISVLGIGESPMAGVGISKNSKTLTALASEELSKLTKSSVNWRILAQSGLTLYELNKFVSKKSPSNVDLIFVAIGGNDIFNLTAPWIWLNHLEICVKYFFKNEESPIILFSAVPCVGRFPAIPNPLRLFFGYWELILQNSLKLFVSKKKNVYLLKERFPDGREYFLEDGIHPSMLAYNLWSKKLASLSSLLMSDRKNL